MIKKLFSHTIIYGLSPQIILIVNFLLLPFITKELTALDYGIYATILTYATAFSILGDLGLKVNITNSFYKSPMQYKWAWRQYYGFLNLWNIVFAGILATVIFFIVPKEALGNRIEIVLLNTLPFVIMGQTGLIGRKYYQLVQKPFQIAWRSLAFGLLTALLNYLFIVRYKMGYMGWFWSTFISTILSNFSYWYALNYKLKLMPIFNFKRRFIKNSLKVALPTIPHFYSGYLLNSSQVMVMDRLNVTTDNIGKYQAANTFASIADGISTAVGWAIGPMLNEKYKKNKDREARNLIFLVQILFLTGTFIGSIWLKEIFKLMIRNESLNKMYYLGIILIMAVNYRPMYFGAVSKLIYYEKTKILWRISLTAGLINIIGNLIFIPVFGFEVAGYIAFLSLTFLGYSGFYFKSFKEVEKENYYPMRWLLITILLCGMATFIVEWFWLYKLLTSLVFITISIYFINRVNKTIS